MTPNGQRQLASLQAPEPAGTSLVPAQVTPWSATQIALALTAAWKRKFEKDPSPSSLAILLSQWALETGRGKSCWGSNLGNARPPWPRGDVLCLQIPGGKVSEVIEGVEYFFSPPSVGSTFRAFQTLAEAADWYLNSLYTRFAHAWPSVLMGDPVAYSVALHESHYYTADVQVYTRTMVALFHEFYTLALRGYEAPQQQIPQEIVSAVTLAHADLWLQTLEPDPEGFGPSPHELDG